jgi:hypothetical protein
MFPPVRLTQERPSSARPILWLAACLLLMIALGACFAFREDIVREFPGLEGAYRALGLRTASRKAAGPVSHPSPAAPVSHHA